MLYPTLNTISKSQNAGMQLLLVTAEDLREFARDIAREVREQNEPQYFTRKELINYLGVCSRTLYSYENDGIITAKKVGSKKLYLKADIYAAIEERKLKRNKFNKS
jgi:predicted transcriptional regulator